MAFKAEVLSSLLWVSGSGRAEQYVGIYMYHTRATYLKYRDAISKKHSKTDYRDIEISQ